MKPNDQHRPGSIRILAAALTAIMVAVLALVGTSPADASFDGGTVVVANRADGTLTLIDVRTDQPSTLALPAGENQAEPMYVVYSARKVFVGDRANDRVLVIDPRTWDVVDEIPTGAGVFHMWADPTGRQLWVNNDVDNTITVIDPRRHEVLETVDLPADLAAAGGKPHDVILDRRSAYVTLVGLDGENDAVLRYDLRTFEVQARTEVGKDPHVTIDPRNGPLYVASQDASEIVAVDRQTLAPIDSVSIPSAHGIDLSRNGRVVYTTNIAGGGSDALWAVDAWTGEVIGEPADVPVATPHNVVLTGDGTKAYVTHSGATADQVSVYEVSRRDPAPRFVTTIDAGLNPFGLEFVPR